MALRSELHGQELVAVKEGDSAEALRHEAELLSNLDHPGIVAFVALTDDERGLRLLTRYAGRETLATWQPQQLEELRRVVEEVAETVRHLHERGIAHRDIRPAHVVIDPLRRPRLCGFSAARRDACDDAAEHLADVRAIGEMVLAVLQRLETQQPRPGQRRDEQRLRQRIQAVAQAAGDGRVPSSRALASRLRAVATDSRTPPISSGERQGGPPDHAATLNLRHRRGGAGRAARFGPRRPRRAGWLAAAVVCAGCVLGTLMMLRLGDRNAAATALPTPASPDGSSGPVATAGLPGATSAGTAPPRAPAAARPAATPEPLNGSEPAAGTPEPPGTDGAGCPQAGSGRRDVDGDGCAEEIRILPGFVSVDGVRYPVGAAGDQVAVGDWNCDGVATVALVQSAGRVYLFEEWPQESPLVGTLVAELPPPVELADVPRGACNELTVRYSEGTWYLPLPTAPD
ncbi:MAG: protein kinase [bacterium]|nr:protein kinase [bacterium]